MYRLNYTEMYEFKQHKFFDKTFSHTIFYINKQKATNYLGGGGFCFVFLFHKEFRIEANSFF